VLVLPRSYAGASPLEKAQNTWFGHQHQKGKIRRARKHLRGFDSPAEGSGAEIKASTGKPALGLARKGIPAPPFKTGHGAKA